MRRAALLVLALGLACDRRDPPAPAGSPSISVPSGTAATGTTAWATPEPSAAGADATALDAGLDPASLPQTRDRPASDSPALAARIAALWAAIVADDPELAMPCFFPLAAYRQVKDVSDPASDWKHRLVAAYAHDIHALHRRLGASAASAKLVGLDLPAARARWVDPGEEYNKLGYYRVFGSRLRYTTDPDGPERSFDVKSLISWRGQWYVVHLSAIQ